MMKLKQYGLIACIVCMIAVICGCGQTEQKKEQPVVTPLPVMKTILVYEPTEDAQHLVAHQVDVPEQEATPKRAIEELLKKDASETYPIFPKGTKILDVTVDPKSQVAIANFNQTLQDQVNGGSLGELLMVYMVVSTLTEYPDIHAVRFQIEGKEIDSLNGHMDLSIPVERKSDLIAQ